MLRFRLKDSFGFSNPNINKMWWFLFILSLLFDTGTPFPKKLRKSEEISHEILGIFEKTNTVPALAFKDSCGSAALGKHILSGMIITPNRTDSYSVWRELCATDVRPIAIFGPQSAISDIAVRDQCSVAQIPHLQATWQPYDPDRPDPQPDITEEESPDTKDTENSENTDDTEGSDYAEESDGAEEETTDTENTEDTESINEEVPEYKNITINFYPSSDDITTAYAKLLQLYDWKKFAAFYEDDFGLLRIQKIIAEHSTEYPIFFRKLDPDNNNYQVFKGLKEYNVDRILIDCHADKILRYMIEADEMKVVDHYHHFIFVTLDGSVAATELLSRPCNASWLSLIEFDKQKDTQHELSAKIPAWKNTTGKPHLNDFQLEALLMSDMANHVIKAVSQLKELDISAPSCICDCSEQELWENGAILQNEILKTNTTGLTGNIQFDETGKRFNYTLYVNEIHMNNRKTIGQWMSTKPDHIELKAGDASEVEAESNVKEFIIISRKAKPYFWDKEPCVGDNCTEDDEEKFEGFSVDLVKEIFRVMRTEFGHTNYKYKFVHEEDKKYGSYDEHTKKWTGLIGDLLDKKADLAVCDLTITEERKKVVDFSVPFMSLGISILFTQEHKVPPRMFSFLNPYDIEVWMYTATAYCVVSLVLFVCARLSPADWENPQPCDKDPEELENIWNFKNCTWLTMGSIMTQGCDILPKALGSRWVCAMWWFFAVIVCQTYIAQLSASMTYALEDEPINSVEDLAKQNKILYGAIKDGSTYNFFKNSNDKIYQSIFAFMESHKAVMVGSNDEGENRVLNNKLIKYAFFMESTTIEYKMKRNCALKKVGPQLDSKDYGIAMPANSPFRTDINRAILKLKEMTLLDQIKDTWWNKKYNAIECPKEDTSDVEGDLEMENLIGAFVVLIFGLFVCLIITAAEFMDEVRNIVVREQVTHKEAFIKELKASLNFFQLQKPVLRNPSRAPSVISDKSQLEEKLSRRAQAIENFMDLEKMVQ